MLAPIALNPDDGAIMNGRWQLQPALFIQQGFCIVLAGFSRSRIGAFKAQCVGSTCRHARGFFIRIDPVPAVVAFQYLSAPFIPVGNPPGAGVDTGFAADAQPGFHKNDSILFSLFNGIRRAGCHAPGLFAVKAGPEGGKDTDFSFLANRLRSDQ